MNVKRMAALSLSAALLASPAYADGFAVYEWSARGVGMAGAMMFSDEASLIAYNPAAITQFDERGNFSAAVTYIAPRGEAEFLNSAGQGFLTQHNKNNPAYVPAMFYARQVQPNAWFGLGLFPRFGLRASYDHGWYGRFSNRSAELDTISFTPTIAWKMGPSLSMSLGAELMYLSLYIDKSANMSSLYPALSETEMKLDGDSWGIGWNVGLNWNATEKLSLAFLYRSEIKQTVTGDVGLGTVIGDFSSTAGGDVRLPESYTLGVGWKFDDRTRVEFDAIRTNWSSYDSLTFNIKIPQYLQAMLPISSLVSSEAKYWSDGWRYQFGIEHKLNERWTIRAGFVYDECSSDNPDYSDFMVPTGTRRTYTIGASYRVKNIEYSLGYGYMTVDDKRINGQGLNGEDAYTRNCDSHIIAIGARIDL